METFIYLFALASPSNKMALKAWEVARSQNLRVSAQTGDHLLEVKCTPEQAEKFFASGLFSFYTAKAVKEEHLKKLPDEVQAYVASWNERFSPAYQKIVSDKSTEGISWGSEKLQAAAPYAPVPPEKVFEKIREVLAKQGKMIDPRTVKPEIKVSYEALNAEQEKLLLDYFRKFTKDSSLAFITFRVFYASPVELKPYFLDLKWTEIIIKIIDLLLHEQETGEPSCLKMHGRNSVGIVFVESSLANGPKFSTAERSTIENQIRSGLDFLVNEHPSGNLVWIYDVQRIQISVADRANLATSNINYDRYWREPAMGQVNFRGHTYTAGDSEIEKYRADMRAHHISQHATVIFISAFGMSWHGYSVGRNYIVMGPHGNNWGGWSINSVGRIGAHEMCHQFGAADEYTGSGTPCSSCGGEYGCDKIPNGNCGTCGKPQIPCFMHENQLTICNYTKAQIGWADLFVELQTGTDLWAGTDDKVVLDIGCQTFNLDIPHHNDFERGNVEGYAIWAGGNLDRNSIKRILIRKDPDGFLGGWKLKRIRVWHRGDLICDKSPNVWLENRKTWHLAQTFDNSIINTLKLRVSTANDLFAGTDDDVTLQLAGRSWNIDSDGNDFERGSTKTYDLDPRSCINTTSLTTITIKKSPDGFAGGWKLKGLQLTVNGVVKYENNNINQWLENNHRTFTANL